MFHSTSFLRIGCQQSELGTDWKIIPELVSANPMWAVYSTISVRSCVTLLPRKTEYPWYRCCFFRLVDSVHLLFQLGVEGFDLGPMPSTHLKCRAKAASGVMYSQRPHVLARQRTVRVNRMMEEAPFAPHPGMCKCNHLQVPPSM